MRVLACFAALFGLLFSAQAAWYWPDLDPDSTNKPPRLHRLLEKANEYIELAEDEALEGNGDKAIEQYRLALGELDRIEEENPDRAESQEFAPLRNKRASCTAAIDAIRFAQVNENERAVSVTNTRELERKWRKKHNMLTPEDLEEDRRAAEEAKRRAEEKKAQDAEPKDGSPAKTKPEETKPEEKRKPPEPKAAEPKVEESKAPEPKAAEPKPVTTSESAEHRRAMRTDDSLMRLMGRDAELPGNASQTNVAAVGAGGVPRLYADRLRTAVGKLRAGDYATADQMLEGLTKEKPNDLNTMLLRAAAQAGLGSNFAARRTLEKAMKSHPKSYLPCYNLAGLSLRLGEDAESARRYYEKGRALGGPRNEKLEELLK